MRPPIVALILAAPLLAPCGQEPRMPGPFSAARAGELRAFSEHDAARADQRCVSCHTDVADEHAISAHAQSATNASYRQAFALEPLPFCAGCHAPEADPAGPGDGRAVAMGIGCVTCHVTSTGVLAAARPGASESAPHPVVRDLRFGSMGACAGCHEFAFPDSTALMQSTVSEHARSPFASTTCADCHMPAGADESHRSHAFAGPRDRASLARAIDVTAERTGPTSIAVRIAPNGVGHALPTGDLFRRLMVSADVTGGEFAIVAHDERFLGRRFAPAHIGLARRVEIADERVQPGRVELVDLEVGPAGEGAPIDYRVTLERAQQPVGDGWLAEIASRTIIAEGRVP